MDITNSLPITAPATGRPAAHGAHLLRRMLRKNSAFELLTTYSAERQDAEDYVARCFARAYGADVTQFAPLLLTLQCAGRISGVAGVRPAGAQQTFVENYIDEPIEKLASRMLGTKVHRHDIAEVGNLASLQPGACQVINIVLAASLLRAGFRYAVLVSTAQLEKILRKQNFSLIRAGAADPARLGAAADKWGSYYSTEPQILFVNLEATVDTLESQALAAAVMHVFASQIDTLATGYVALNYALSRMLAASTDAVFLP